MLSRPHPALETVDPQLLVQAMSRFVGTCSASQLERGILRSIPTLDRSHRGALARALTDDRLFSDATKVDDSTLRDTVRFSSRSGELTQSFLHFLTSNPRALEQLHPQMVNGIFGSLQVPSDAFEETLPARRWRDMKVGAVAALATLVVSIIAYAGWSMVRTHHRDDALQLAASTASYEATPSAQPAHTKNRVVHGAVRRYSPAPAAAPSPIVKQVFIKQLVVKEVQSQSIPASGNAPRATASPQLRKLGRTNVAGHGVRFAAMSNPQSVKQATTGQAPSIAAAATSAPASTAPSSRPVIVTAPQAPTAAPLVAAVQPTASVVNARDFVASTIRAATPDAKITNLWVSDGGGDVTIVEAESSNRNGAFYDKYAVRPSNGTFLVASHEQIPLDLTSAKNTKSPSPHLQRRARSLFGHIRTAHSP